VNHDCHPTFVGSSKDTAQSSHMARIIHVYVGVTEMHLETVVKVWVFGTPLDLGNGVGLERVNATKSAKPIGIFRYLVCRPVVFPSYLLVLVCNRSLVWVTVLIRERQNECSSDSRCIQQRNQIGCREWLG
jgi:hypothetical protein